ncbi:MAG: hypothetical protein PVI21_06250 [Candidatus Woesebacteria bacterium]|jgi:hypothetical protein
MATAPDILDVERGKYVILKADLSSEQISVEAYGKRVGETYGISNPRVVSAVIGDERSDHYAIIVTRRGSGSGGWGG